MKISPTNTFFIISVLFYLIAGITALLNTGYSIFTLLAAIIFLAFGLFFHTKIKMEKLFKIAPKK